MGNFYGKMGKTGKSCGSSEQTERAPSKRMAKICAPVLELAKYLTGEPVCSIYSLSLSLYLVSFFLLFPPPRPKREQTHNLFRPLVCCMFPPLHSHTSSTRVHSTHTGTAPALSLSTTMLAVSPHRNLVVAAATVCSVIYNAIIANALSLQSLLSIGVCVCAFVCLCVCV